MATQKQRDAAKRNGKAELKRAVARASS